jgi:translation initiation factor IF-2
MIILVVAADDSVMPQTLEALKHAKAANVPIIVALNKIDKPEAKPDQVKQDLARHGVEIEDYGGEVQVVEVSGKTGQGMQDLEEAIVALSEVQDQRAPNNGPVEGWILESSTKEVGKVATVLIRRGTLRPGDIIVAGTEYCRVRTMRDEFGNQISQVSPGMPVEIDGWRGQPKAGDEVLQAANEQVAQDVTDLREAKLKRAGLGKDVEAINEMRKAQQRRHEREKAIARAHKEGIELPVITESTDGPGIKNVYYIVKGDVAGSVEAVVNAISTLGSSEVQPVVLKAGVGAISESDIDHATAAGGQVISFNTNVSPTMRALAERAGTKILDHNIIYRLVDDVKASLEDVLPPIVRSRVLGEAEIAQVFEINVKRKKQKIAGCKVRNGTILMNSKVRVARGFGNDVVYSGVYCAFYQYVLNSC